ncbi:MAG: efflux RND transporter periplasmic adaptor subunit [Deltaproteobacteria bacterium]|nr:efflux RND transporter periplasmic adaptor subunit [Deltaproteobacteria bacterium]
MIISRTPIIAVPATAIYTLGLLLGVVIYGCEHSSTGASLPPIPQAQLVRQGDGLELLELQPHQIPDLKLTAVQEEELPGVLETTGQISFDDRRVANIVSRVAGRIEQVMVSQWDYVRRGQPIVTLYSPDYMTAEAEYLQARASAPALAAGGAGNNEFARSMIEAAQRKLELLGIEPEQIARIRAAAPSFTMRAPISGTIVQNQALRGSAVNPGDVLYSLGTLDVVWITGDIYEDELARVQVGQPLQAVTTAYPDEVFHGTIARISPNLDPNTHTAQIRCAVNNAGSRLKPQMLARVRIVVRPGRALVAPLNALVFETDAYFAYVDLGGGRLERRKVTIASWNQRGIARVVSGLSAGDQVVTNATLQVDELWHQAHGESS